MPSFVTGDISCSYDLVNLFNNYVSYTGVTSNSTLVTMTQNLAAEIYRRCGNSPTSTASKWCPPKSYIENNYTVNYKSGGVMYGVYINIPSNYTDDQLVKMSDITYGGVATTTSSQYIRPYGKTSNTVSYTYYVSYERYYQNLNSKVNNIRFYGYPAFYTYLTTVDGNGSLTFTSGTSTYKYYNLVHTGCNIVTDTIKCRDMSVPDVYGTYVINFTPRPVSSIATTNYSSIPTYCVVNNTNNTQKYNCILYGSSTNTSSGFGVTGKCPIPQLLQSYTYNPTNGDLYQFTDGVINPVGAVTSFSTSSTGTITIPTTYKLATDGTKYTLASISSISGFNHDGSSSDYLMFVTQAYNYDGTIKSTTPRKIYYIKEPTSVEEIQSDETIINGIPANIYLDVYPNNVYFKSVALTCSTHTISNNIQLSNLGTGNPCKINFNTTFTLTSTSPTSASITATITKHDNTTITRTKTVGVYYGPYSTLYMNISCPDAIKDNTGVNNNHTYYFIDILNDATPWPFPADFVGGAFICDLEIFYRTQSGTKTDYIEIHYERISFNKYRLKFQVVSSYGTTIDADGIDNSLVLHFSENAIVTNIKLNYPSNPNDTRDHDSQIIFSENSGNSVTFSMTSLDTQGGWSSSSILWDFTFNGWMTDPYNIGNSVYCHGFGIEVSLQTNT